MTVISQPFDQQDEEMLVPQPDLVEDPTSMEIAEQQESDGTVENQPVDESQANRFTWTIENFSRLNARRHYSEIFRAGGCTWRLLMFPKGNTREDALSIFLDVADASVLPYGWSRYAQFCFTLVNQINSRRSISKEALHNFNAKESDWGFSCFMRLDELHDPSTGYVVNDTCIIIADVAVRRVVDNWLYDSKKETGYVGLKNQGATCYMNSLLQTLYHIPYFRKAVYHMPITENAPSGSISMALQSLFYKVQYSDTRVATKELTKSFGWNTYDSFMQHDVQELNRVLCEKLENKMKGTVVEGTMGQLFEGHLMNYIECIDVDFKSTRKESFYDLQLDVKGCCDVYASFDKYVEVERLDGDNKYQAEGHGLQDAKKGNLFTDFPPVLQLHLKRFEYDFMRDSMVKINDHYEFPLELDLDRENGKYLSPDADRSIRNLYTLHSVLVHSGGVHGGHYYAFIRPNLSDQWFKFDDERVTKEDKKNAMEEQYGGEEELPRPDLSFDIRPIKFTRFSNAYMLVYVRESDKDKIMCAVGEKEIPDHLRLRFKKEQEEKENRRRYKAEACLYTIIKVARDDDLIRQIGKDVQFDLVDCQKVRNFRVQRQTAFKLFKEEVAKEFGIPVQCQRFWIWAKRQNHTYRPLRPIVPLEELKSIEQLRVAFELQHDADLRLFLEVELGLDKCPIPPPDITSDDILLFFKLYDPKKEELRYVGRLFVKNFHKPIEILIKLNEMAGFALDEELQLFEELSFKPRAMCSHIDKKVTFEENKLGNGDIICFQKLCSNGSHEQYRCPDVPSFLCYLQNRHVVHFRSLERSREDEFCLELLKSHTYDDVVERLADRIGLDDPSKIRLTAHNCSSQQPRPQSFRYRQQGNLFDLLFQCNQLTDILYYEVLDIPLPELQRSKLLNVYFYHGMKDEVTNYCIRMPKSDTVRDLIIELKTKVQLSHPDAELRLLGIHQHRICKIYPPHQMIEDLDGHLYMVYSLRAEEIPEDEKNLGPSDRVIHVYHFMEARENRMQVQNFGEPFLFAIHEGETLAQVKLRIQKKLQVPDEEFSKWKFASVSIGRPDYLQDADIVLECFQRRNVYGPWEQYLGLEHVDTTPRRAHIPSHNRSTFDNSVKIYN